MTYHSIWYVTCHSISFQWNINILWTIWYLKYHNIWYMTFHNIWFHYIWYVTFNSIYFHIYSTWYLKRLISYHCSVWILDITIFTKFKEAIEKLHVNHKSSLIKPTVTRLVNLKRGCDPASMFILTSISWVKN